MEHLPAAARARLGGILHRFGVLAVARGAVAARAVVVGLLARSDVARLAPPGLEGGRLERATSARHPACLDALAAAHAGVGLFKQAVGVAQQALQRAGEVLAKRIRSRIELYRNGKALRGSGVGS